LRREAGARLEIIADTYLSLGTPVQLAVPALLAARGAFQAQVMARVRNNLAEFDRQLVSAKTCSRLKIEGGWNAVLQVPATISDEDRALALVAKKAVYVHPGHFYDFQRDGHLVLSLIVPEQDFRTGLARLLALVDGGI
jgi:hypothetical protein